MLTKYLLCDINTVNLKIKYPCIFYIKGDLGSGKTTFSKYIINDLLGVKEKVLSPTYVYYNKYKLKNGKYVYHFDLYKIKDYDEFFAIGGEDIFDNNSGIIIVEWPDIISKYYKCDTCIELEKGDKDNERLIKII